MIATLIDYGAGNVTSVARALRRLGAEVRTTDQPEELTTATCLILPGVGHCAALLHSLDARGLRQPLLTAISRGTPFLGICLGLQALYQSSAEDAGAFRPRPPARTCRPSAIECEIAAHGMESGAATSRLQAAR